MVPGMSTESLARPADLSSLLATWLSGRAAGTRRAYLADLRHFADWLGLDTPAAAAGVLVTADRVGAHRAVTAWRGAMLEDGLAPATVNRRLSVLRSLVKLGCRLGYVSWALDVPSAAAAPVRDSRGGLSWEEYRARVEADGVSVRDRAICALAAERGLRRAEIVSLDVEHVERDGAGAVVAVHVARKGRRGARERLTLAESTGDAVAEWINRRGEGEGLFPGYGGTRLGGDAVYRIVRRVTGTRPHGLRHLAITRALDVTAGNVRDVAKFAGHANVATTMRYDDERRDVAGDVARKVADNTP